MKDAAFETARELILSRLHAGKRIVAALEGGAGSGKTTLAAALAEAFSAPVIAMDDFFLPPSLRTPERLREPGGNIHYERFEEQVARPLRAGEKEFSYDVYDCHAGAFAGKKKITGGPLILVEGVYSLHPRYADLYDLRLFLHTSPETQDARLQARGPWLYEKFQQLWLPMEKAYFAGRDWKALCDAVLET